MKTKFIVPLAIPLFLGALTHCNAEEEYRTPDVWCGLNFPPRTEYPQEVIISPTYLSAEEWDELGEACPTPNLPGSYLIEFNLKPGKYKVSLRAPGAYGYLLESGQHKVGNDVTCQEYSNCTFSYAPDACFQEDASAQDAGAGELGGASGITCEEDDFFFRFITNVEVTPEDRPVLRLFQQGIGRPTVEVEAL
jgi:hypothetical protein